MKKLSQLSMHIPGLISHQAEDILISGIAIDSRVVKPGDVFVATVGFDHDGHSYIPEAINAGAVAVVGTSDMMLSIPYIQVADGREALAHLSASFFDFPAKNMTVIGVTGTDGKTTTSNLLYNIIKAAGLKAGMISTVNAVIGDQVLDTGLHVTTPDAPDLQKYLSLMVKSGLTHAVLETTSHGLEQKRVDACEFDIGVITNITHEHLDAHTNSIDRYRAAKGRLFSLLADTGLKDQGNPRLSVVNMDDWSFEYLQEFIPGSQVSYGLDSNADIRAVNPFSTPSGISFTAVGENFEIDVNSPLIGAYNISNCLAAIATAIIGLGIGQEAVVEGISSLKEIPGRFMQINLGQKFSAIVDFAHTPNALLNVLKTARTLTEGKVILVFGSAGLRDREKRKMMAEVSAEWADLTILTAEDPRTESLNMILQEMAEGAELKGGVRNETFWCVPDRRDAIRFAIRLAEEDDFVILCGKGHEQSMCFGKTEYFWDDQIALKAALSEYLEVEGPMMPYLPTQD